jgi:serine/threonine protein kinase
MSPEQAAGKIEAMGPPADVYAVGAMLYHLLARSVPYANGNDRLDNHGILRCLEAGPPAGLATLAPETAPELVAICEKAMARDPAARYADMSAMAEDLRAFLENRVVPAYETGAVAELRKWIVRNKPLASALAAVIVVLLAGLAASLIFKAQSDHNAEIAVENEARVTKLANDVLSFSASNKNSSSGPCRNGRPRRRYCGVQSGSRRPVLIEGSHAPAPGTTKPSSPRISRRAGPAHGRAGGKDRRTSPTAAELEYARAKRASAACSVKNRGRARPR